MLVSFICYAFNLTLSTGRRHWYALSFVLPTGVTGQHYYADFSLSITTNWLGYILLAGLSLPQAWWSCRITGMSIKLRCVFSVLAY